MKTTLLSFRVALNTALALLCAAPALASQQGLGTGVEQPKPLGTVVAGNCPSGQANVRMYWTYDPDRQHIRTFKNPGFITRCVELAPGVKPVEGATAVLGHDVDMRFKVLALRDTPAKR